ncbi:MAG TPA: 3-hydroxyacyl-CoA dehydrogenase NAD-binding domain-containing protein [Oculatellaceae cyanobacterium]
MAIGPIQLKVSPKGVGIITIDLPDSKVNTLGSTSMGELLNVLQQVTQDASIKGLVIVSGKSDNFVAGADIGEIQALQSQPAVKSYEASKLGKEVFSRLEQLSFRTVAAINGTCLGGGTELTLCCKYRIATNSSKTKIGLPETKLGFIPGWGGTIRLPRLIGIQKALDLIANGNDVDAKKAWRLGLVDEVVEPEKLLERAEEIALGAEPKRSEKVFDLQKMLLEENPLGRYVMSNEAKKLITKKTKGKYPAPVEAAKVIFKSYEQTLDQAFEAESQAFGKLATTATSKNLVGLFYAQTESKKMPDGVTSDIKVETVGVIGAGVMGAEIAEAAAYNGYTVYLKDIDQAALDKGIATAKGLIDGLVSKKKLSQSEAAAIMGRIKPTLSYADMADCDLVIEAVVEVMKVKQAVLKELEEAIKKPFVFASNTSSLSVSEMASVAKEPKNVVGIHFFNPVHKMLLVEIVRANTTSNETVAAAQSFAMKLGKTTVVTGDAPGFVVNRILAPYLREAIVLLEQGVPPEEIDKAMTTFGMPMGPLALMDEVGLDIGEKVIHVLHAALGERMAPPAILNVVSENKLLGKKGGKGIYLYNEEGRRDGFNPTILFAVTAEATPKQRGEIQDRLSLVMVNEAARCIEEGVIHDPSQLDLAMVFGTGFAPFYGGVLRFADQVGLKIVQQKLEYLSKVCGGSYVPCKLLTEKAMKGENFYPAIKVPVEV